jgi:rod shape-determining protein MreB and related proteins
LAADIVDQGIFLPCGVALLKGLDELMKQETNFPIKVADDPLAEVALMAKITM